MPLDRGYVSDVPYEHAFICDLAPARLDHVALISAVAPPSRDKEFTWCDLGCGQGFTASALAATHETGRFYGIDAIPAHIENARRFAAECAITNVEFLETGFAEAAEMGLGSFDYIVCHGVYSWVDETSRAALRHFVDSHLKPGGLFYVSYNALPGRAAELPLQRLTRTLADTLVGDSATRCADSLAVVAQLTALKAPALVASPLAMQLAARPKDFPRNYLAHELLSADWEPLGVADVRAAMRGIDLVPVGSATLIENYDSFVLTKSARRALEAILDEDAREFARDFLIDQFFRKDVFVRDARPLDEDERRDRLMASSFLLMRPVDTIEYAMKTPAGRVRYDNATARAVVAALASGPRSLADIIVEKRLDPQEALANTLLLCASDAIYPVEASSLPTRQVNEASRRRLGQAAEIGHFVLPCGTALPVNANIRQWMQSGECESAAWRTFLQAHCS